MVLKTSLRPTAKVAFFALLLCGTAHAQLVASGSFSSDVLNNQVTLVTLAGNGTAVSLGASTTGMLSCTTTYPVITFYVTRGMSHLSLAVIQTNSGTSWTNSTPSFNGLLTSDVVYAQITAAGSGCTNDVPLNVSFSYIPSAATNICQASPSPCTTLVGVLAGANGSEAQNDVLNFQPNQWFYVSGASGSGAAGVMINTSTYCGTSSNGAVVGVPNPNAAPAVSQLFSGTLTAGTYFVEYSFYDYAGNETLVSPELSIVLGSTGGIQVNPPPGLPAGVAGMRVYIGTSSGGETLQGSTTGNASFTQNTPLTAGTSPLSANTTVCKIVANDAGWPTGTGYTVSLTDQAGNTFPGYPMQWQILGANSTINLSNGIPYYHGVVTFPAPLLASPLNQATQSINGSLSLGPFTLYGQKGLFGYYASGGPVAGETDYIAGCRHTAI